MNIMEYMDMVIRFLGFIEILGLGAHVNCAIGAVHGFGHVTYLLSIIRDFVVYQLTGYYLKWHRD